MLFVYLPHNNVWYIWLKKLILFPISGFTFYNFDAYSSIFGSV